MHLRTTVEAYSQQRLECQQTDRARSAVPATNLVSANGAARRSHRDALLRINLDGRGWDMKRGTASQRVRSESVEMQATASATRGEK